MFSTLHPYLFLLFSHFVFFLLFSHFLFLFWPSFSYSSRHETRSTIYNVWWFHYNLPVYHGDKKTLHNQNKYSNIIILGTKYELFLLPYQITFFLLSGKLKYFKLSHFNEHFYLHIILWHSLNNFPYRKLSLNSELQTTL